MVAPKPCFRRPRRRPRRRSHRPSVHNPRPTRRKAAGGSDVDWVEVKGRTVEVAVEAALQELGLSSPDEADVEILQEPQRGFLGLGGKDALVRVKPKRAPSPSRRRRRRRENGGEGAGGPAAERPRPAPRPNRERERMGDRGRQPDRQGGRGGQGPKRPRGGEQASERGGRGGREGHRPEGNGRPDMSIDEQAKVVERFLTGLLGAFGLEGSGQTRVEEDVVIADVSGDQTQALVGPRGSTLEAIHEVCRTVLQKHARETARLRLDIAGYGERRRQALTIYASQLIDQVMAEGGEIMLEPMSASDRKVIHDAVAAREGVRSFSEGEPPRRYVVIAVSDDGLKAQ